MDLTYMNVIDLQVVQSNTAGGSALMEKHGFLQSLQFIHDNGLEVKELVTDRHPQILKAMRELRDQQERQHQLQTKHSVDVWHVSKGLKKKLTAISKNKECRLIGEWIRSIVNHLYWMAVSTPDAEPQIMVEKWRSLINHLHNHHHHDGPNFKECQHEDLTKDSKQRKWLKGGTDAAVQAEKIVLSRQMLKDVPMLSTGPQTAAIEGFHSVLNHFAPKGIGFSFHGMLYRNLLAALHYNENSEREQAKDKEGKAKFRLAPRKARKEYYLQEVKVDSTYDYVTTLMEVVGQLASTHTMAEMLERQRYEPAPPSPLSRHYQRQDLEEAITTHMCDGHLWTGESLHDPDNCTPQDQC